MPQLNICHVKISPSKLSSNSLFVALVSPLFDLFHFPRSNLNPLRSYPPKRGGSPSTMSLEVRSRIPLEERFNNVLHYYEDSSDDLDLQDWPKTTQGELKLHLETTIFRLISWSVDVQVDAGGLNGIEGTSLGLAVELKLWELEELLRDFLRSERSATTLPLTIGHVLDCC
jgi:hypothetical protein